jgi:hypothetical protein
MTMQVGVDAGVEPVDEAAGTAGPGAAGRPEAPPAASRTRRKSTAGRAAGAGAGRESRRVATPWGAAALLAEAKVAQRAGERRFSTVLELLESDRGDLLVRFAYTTDGVARRGPVTLRLRDVERLRAAAAHEPRLAAALGWPGDDA